MQQRNFAEQSEIGISKYGLRSKSPVLFVIYKEMTGEITTLLRDTDYIDSKTLEKGRKR